MKNLFNHFVTVGFLILSFAISIFSAFTSSWKYQDLDIFYGIKVFAVIMLITFIFSLPDIVFRVLDKKKGEK